MKRINIIIWKTTILPRKVIYKVFEWRLPAIMPLLIVGAPPTKEYTVTSIEKAMELEKELSKDKNVYKIKIGVQYKRARRRKNVTR